MMRRYDAYGAARARRGGASTARPAEQNEKRICPLSATSDIRERRRDDAAKETPVRRAPAARQSSADHRCQAPGADMPIALAHRPPRIIADDATDTLSRLLSAMLPPSLTLPMTANSTA